MEEEQNSMDTPLEYQKDYFKKKFETLCELLDGENNFDNKVISDLGNIALAFKDPNNKDISIHPNINDLLNKIKNSSDFINKANGRKAKIIADLIQYLLIEQRSILSQEDFDNNKKLKKIKILLDPNIHIGKESKTESEKNDL